MSTSIIFQTIKKWLVFIPTVHATFILSVATLAQWGERSPSSEHPPPIFKEIAALKYNKAAGIDDVLVEQLKNLGPRAHKWLQTMLSKCITENKIPKLGRQLKIIAILNLREDSAIPKSYRPISLLCHTYKLYERIIIIIIIFI